MPYDRFGAAVAPVGVGEPSERRRSPARTCLVVAPDVRMTRLLGFVLRAHHYEVAVATSIFDALTRLRDPLPALVLVDLDVGGGDGMVLCRRLRGITGGTAVALVVCTADHRPAATVAALAAGADDVVRSPFAVEELLARVDAAVRRTCVVS